MVANVMSRVFKKLGKEEKGFTLIELLAVIVILAVIAVIAIPMIGNVISKSKSDADVATARQIYDAARLYVIGEKGGDFKGAGEIKITSTTETETETLTAKGYLDKEIFLPSTKEKVNGGTVVFDGNGVLASVTITTENSGNKAFTAAEVLKQKKEDTKTEPETTTK